MGNYAGLIINGVAANNGNTGYSVDGIGDINGDGIDDIAISSPFADVYDATNEYTAFNRGTVYVVFGQDGDSFPTEINLADLDGTDGFAITPQLDLTDGGYGGSLYQAGGARFGHHVAGLGDVNGDGVADFGIVQRASDSTSNFYYEGGSNEYNALEGVAYVVYGGQEPFNAVESITDLSGFRIDAEGYMNSIVALGDVNGDGIADIGVNAVNRFTDNIGTTNIYNLYDYDGNGVYDPGTNDTYDIYSVDFAVGEVKAFVIYGTDVERVTETPIADPENDGGGIVVGLFSTAVALEEIADTVVNTELMDGSDGFTIITGATATANGFYYGYYGGGFYGSSQVEGGLQAMGDFNGDGFTDLMIEESNYFIDPIMIIRTGPPDFTYDRYGGGVGNSTTGNFLIYGDTNGLGAGVAEVDITAFPTPAEVDYQVFRFATFNDSRAPLGDVSGDDGLADIGFSDVVGGTFDPITGITDTLFATVVINGTMDDPFSPSATGSNRELLAQDVVDGQGAIYYDASSNLSETSIGISNAEARGVGDINNDGTDDFLISGRHFGTAGDSSDDTQMMYLVLGQTSAVTGLFELGAMVDAGEAYRILPLEDENPFNQIDLAAAGDFNGDGIDDILLGSASQSGYRQDAGRGIVIFGDGLEAADAADGTDDNTIRLSNLNVDIDTGLRPTEIRFEDAGFFGTSLLEGDGGTTDFEFDVIRTGNLTETVTVDFAVSPTGASPASADDFAGGAFPSGTVTFASGEAVATVTIPVSGDLDRENAEDFAVTLSNPTTDGTNGLIITGAETFGRIFNDDLPAQVQISYSAQNGVEDTPASDPDAGSRFFITRSGDIDSTVTMDFEVDENMFASLSSRASADDFFGFKIDGGVPTAFSGTAFPLTGTVTMAPGETFKELRILPNPDSDIELSERFQVTLSNLSSDGVQGAEILFGRDTGYGTIINDDFNPGVLLTATATPSSLEGTAADGVPVNEIVFTLTKRGNIADPVDVTYNLNTGTVVAPFAADQDDFVGVTFPDNGVTVTLPAGIGTSVEVRLPINPDTAIEPREYVQMEIVSVSGAPGVTYDIPAQTRGLNITNDDGRPPVPVVWIDENENGIVDPGEEIRVEADVFGDPHITTLDGLGYDFQTVGEYILVETESGATNPFAVQVRFEPFPGSDVVSVTTRMAVTVNGATIEIDALGSDPLLIDGVAPSATDLAIGGVDVDGDGQFDIEFDGALGEFTIYLNSLSDGSAEQLKVGIFDGSLNICVFLGDPSAGGNSGAVQGLMGNANGDLTDDYALRDGSPVPSGEITFDAEGVPQLEFDYLYGAYADSWRIDSGERTFTDTVPTFPDGFPAAAFSLDDLPQSVIDAATAAAMEAGLDPADNQVIFDAAVLDFALTGSTAFFDSAQVLVAEPEAASAPTSAPVTPATVGVSAVTSSVTEGDSGSQTVTFTFYRVGDTTGEIDVDYAVGGDADADDLAAGTALSGTVSFGDGEDTKSITLDITGDLANEDTEDLVVSITGTSVPGALIAASQGITSIINDDFVPVAADDMFTTDEDTQVAGNLFAANPTDTDDDADGDSFSVTSVNGMSPAGGSLFILASGAHLRVEANGDFTYDPFGFDIGLGNEYDTIFDRLADGEVASESFTYTIADGNGGDDTGEVMITVTGANDAPVATLDEFSVDENGVVNGNVLTGDGSPTGPDVDPEGGPLTVTQIDGVDLADADEDSETAGTQVTFGDGGTVTISANGDVSYDTNDSFEGLGDGAGQLLSRLQSINITIADDQGATDTSALRFSVQGSNDDPVAGDDLASTEEGTAVTIPFADLLANDSDVDSATLTITGASDPTDGTVDINADSFTYTPDTGFIGTDTFTYTVEDGHGGSTTAQVSVTVNEEPNTDPVAGDDFFTVSEDAGSAVLGNLLDGDNDPDGDDLTVIAASVGATMLTFGMEQALDDGGLITVAENGDVTFDPNGDFDYLFESEPFELFVNYTISDGNGGSASAVAQISVQGVNDVPVAMDDSGTVGVGETSTDIAVLDNDSDAEDGSLDVTDFSDPAGGSVQILDGDVLRYTPDTGFFGTDSFTYEISDGDASATATVTIVVAEPENQPPVAMDDSASTDEDNDVGIQVLSNDNDPDEDPIMITGISMPDNGTAEVDPEDPTSILYTPAPNFNGNDQFTYVISDGELEATATVTVTVAPVNDDPVAEDDSDTTSAGTPVVIDVLANDGDVDGDDLMVSAVFADDIPGTVDDNGDGTLTFTPDEGFVGDVTFGYEVSDGNGGTDVGEVSVTVEEEPTGKNLQPEDFDNVFVGSPGPDPHQGTDLNDWIEGGGGRDNIFGGAGQDYIIAGPGNDWWVRGGADADWFQFGLGDGDVQIADFEIGLDRICLDGIALEDLTYSTQTHNGVTTSIFRTSVGDRLMLQNVEADQADDIMFDVIGEGGGGNPFNPGEKPFDPDVFDNFFAGSPGADPHQGTAENDWIEGGDGRDNINGGAGRDYIIAGPGNDWWVRGGADADWFQFGAGDGDVKIADFQDGMDRICLDGIEFDDLTMSTQTYQDVVTVIFTTASGDRLMLEDQDPNNITSDDFDFI